MKKIPTLIPIFLLLELPLVLYSLTDNMCFWRIKYERDNDGNMQDDCAFFIYTSQKSYWKEDLNNLLDYRLTPPKYQFVLALAYAIEEINQNPNLLPNISMGFDFLRNRCVLGIDNKYNTMKTLPDPDIIPNYVCDSNPCVVVLTGATYVTSANLAPFLQLFTLPQLTYGPYHTALSDKEQFPYVYQIAPKDTSLALAMVSLLVHFSWNWVGLVISDTDEDIQFLSDIRGETHRNEVCLAFVNVVLTNMELYMKKAEIYYSQIMTLSVNVVIIYGDLNTTLFVSFIMWEYLLSRRIWVTTSQWDVITAKRALILDPFHGTFTFSHHHREISGFKKIFQTLNISQLPEDTFRTKLGWMCFNCSISEYNCQTLDNLSSHSSLEWLTLYTLDMAMSDTSYNVYNAAYAIAHSFHEILYQQVDTEQMEMHGELEEDCRKLHYNFNNIQFTNPVGELVNINRKGRLEAEYDIFNIWNFPQGLGLKVKIGQFSPRFQNGQQLRVSEDMIEWTIGNREIPHSVCSMSCSPGFRKSHLEESPSCCFECIPCPENEISNMTGMEQCVKCPDDQYANREQTHCLQKVVIFLAYEDPLGMTLACIALTFSAFTVVVLGVFVKNHDTPIVKANNRNLSYILLLSLILCFLSSLLFIGHPYTATCILQQTTFGIVFTVAISTILSKTVTVVLAFTITAPGRIQRLLVSGVPKFIIPFCTLIQLTLCGIWLGTSPPFVDTDSYSEHGHIIIKCNKASVTAFYCVLGYLGSLTLVTFTVAFLARNLPDTFNEAKFLTFSMLVFCSVWVTFLPVYHSTKGKVMVAIEVFSILASSAGLLGCIFVPKFYIILLRPNKNCLPHFRNKIPS